MPPSSVKVLERRAAEFAAAPFSVPYLPGPPYPLASNEIDLQRALTMAQAGQRVRVNHSVIDPDILRRARVMFAFAPESDFHRQISSDGVVYDEWMEDIMRSMTSIANPRELRLSSVSPNYAAEFLSANLPGRLDMHLPRSEEDFQTALADSNPDVLLLSGLNVNIRVLVRMALLARQQGVKEVWLGGDAALGPYRILDEMFDRVIWGPGEEYLYQALMGDVFPGHRHPAADRMLAGVHWLIAGEGEEIHQKDFQTLHMVLRMGCTQNCRYCAEGIKSSRGRARPPTPLEEAKRVIDQAYDRGIRRIYFIDPDFGRLWDDNLEGEVLRYLAEKGEKGMKWSCLTNVVTLRKHGQFMIDHGLASVYLGIESLSPDHRTSEGSGKSLLKIINRGWQDQHETVQIARSLLDQGVLVFGLYILYNPGETEEGVLQGVEALKEAVPISQISTNQPFPGTQEIEQAASQGLIHDYDPDSIRYGRMIWSPNGLTGPAHDPDQVTRAYVKAHSTVNRLKRKGGFFDFQRRHGARTSLRPQPGAHR
ncbi:MAG: radical SAM protein [Deltaproteobacteria bacterium]|nr:radical SAM protein [Deltaproteobacteria bacterium]